MFIDAPFYGGLVANNQEVSDRAAQAQNTAREANVRVWQQTRNAGQVRLPTPITFNMFFLEEPSFASGMTIAVPHNDTNFSDPLGGAVVRAWVRDDRGYYTGAYMTYWSDVVPATENLVWLKARDAKTIPLKKPTYTVVHSMSFGGFAYKAFADDVMEEIHLIQPRLMDYQ